MKKIWLILAITLITIMGYGQGNVEVSSTATAGTEANLFTIKNTTAQAANVFSTMTFMNNSRYTGAIKTIGEGAATARLSFFTYSSTTLSSLIERVSILDNGKVGIGAINPNTLFDVIGGSSGSVSTLVTLRSNFIADNTGTGIKLINSTSNSSAVGSEIISQTISSANGKSDLIFKSHGGGGAYGALLERLRLTGYGSLLLTSNNNDASITLAGNTTGAGNNFSITGSNALTSGTDINAGNIILSSGSSQGTGYGRVVFKVAKKGTTGSTTNTPVEVFAIGGSSNNISITDASFNLSHSSPTPNDGMSSQILGASVAAFALWGLNSCPSTAGTGYGNATSNIAVSGQMESDVAYSFGLHAMVTPCTTTLPNNSAGVFGTYTNSSSTMQASGALGYKDGSGNFFGVYGQVYGGSGYYAGGFAYDVLFPTTTNDYYLIPAATNYGYIGTASYVYYYMYCNNFIDPSSKEKKRNVVEVKDDVLSYIMNDIDKLKPSLYKYNFETDVVEKGNETKYRPNLHLGVILEDAPDYIQDNDFSGIDIYALSTLSLVGVKNNRDEIKQLKNEIENLKTIIKLLCEKINLNYTLETKKETKQQLFPPIEGLKIQNKIKIFRTDNFEEIITKKK